MDATGIGLVTIDPPGSRDLDQAVGIERRPGGPRVHYAIADLGAVVAPGDVLDAQVRRRGRTVYLPDGSVPLHPPVLSEGAASLLPGRPRAAVLWTIDLDPSFEVVRVDVRRAVVRSRAQWDYRGAQAAYAAGTLPDAIAAPPEVGRVLREFAIACGAIELELPEQEVLPDGRGGWYSAIRTTLEIEDWNAEISLLTGMCAARIMVDARVGVLRTLPPPNDGSVAALHRLAGHPGHHLPGAECRGPRRAGVVGAVARGDPACAGPGTPRSTGPPRSRPGTPGSAPPMRTSPRRCERRRREGGG